MIDSNGRVITNGDKIKTIRGVELDIVEEDGNLYMLNSGNGQKSLLSRINIDFYVIDLEPRV